MEKTDARIGVKNHQIRISSRSSMSFLVTLGNDPTLSCRRKREIASRAEEIVIEGPLLLAERAT